MLIEKSTSQPKKTNNKVKNMTEDTNVEKLELSDSQLIEVLKNHGINRRVLMKVFGAGAGVAALSSTTAGKGRVEGTALTTYSALHIRRMRRFPRVR